jgi:hypothetical protein
MTPVIDAGGIDALLIFLNDEQDLDAVVSQTEMPVSCDLDSGLPGMTDASDEI